MPAGISLILRKTGAHQLRLRAAALALCGAPLQLLNHNYVHIFMAELLQSVMPSLPRART
jgi:hypothetical protein